MKKILEDLLIKEEGIIDDLSDGSNAQAILVEIVYKSGVTKEFWCKKFTISNGIFEWISTSGIQKPVLLNVDEVGSVWAKDVTIITLEDYQKYPKSLGGYKDFFEGN